MVKEVHLVFKTHLDVGFTGFASAVINRYFTDFIPAALSLARKMRSDIAGRRFIWTTGSWLIYEYLEQAPSSQRREMENAIQTGEITWHALPFTFHTELMDAGLFNYGLSLSTRLDNRFGKQTIAAKYTDVPGHTRTIIPLLADAGIKLLHIGVNSASTPPSVPGVFRWRSPAGSEITIIYEQGYGNICIIPGFEHALAFSHTNDNLGPQSAETILQTYADLSEKFPTSNIHASTLNEFAWKLEMVRNQLPIITVEIGDTWIHGIGSDPIKVSGFRELLRWRRETLEKEPELRSDPAFDAFQRQLLLIPEHTWGMDEKTFLADNENYSADLFSISRKKEKFIQFESSWAEKRAYLDQAINLLGVSPLSSIARSRLQEIRPSLPEPLDWTSLSLSQTRLRIHGLSVNFDPLSGGMNDLVDDNGRRWADPDHPIFTLTYQTFSAADYERFFHQYILPAEQENGWSREDFTKPGLEKVHPESRLWHPVCKQRLIHQTSNHTEILFHLTSEPQSSDVYGCPHDFYLQYGFAKQTNKIQVRVQWFNKPACRMPEAIWLQINPVIGQNSHWRIRKMGGYINPLEVIHNGNRHLHACDELVEVQDKDKLLQICSLDAPLVAPGKPSLLNFTNDQPDLSCGISFNLYNNIWGTNFPMWFEEDCSFRFALSFIN